MSAPPLNEKGIKYETVKQLTNQNLDPEETLHTDTLNTFKQFC